MVLFQGAPIPKGAIRFVTHERTPGEGGIAPIIDGKYAVTTPGMLSGKYVVMISGFQATGRKLTIDGNEVAEERQYVPEKFNANSNEQVELNPGENVRDFTL